MCSGRGLHLQAQSLPGVAPLGGCQGVPSDRILLPASTTVLHIVFMAYLLRTSRLSEQADLACNHKQRLIGSCFNSLVCLLDPTILTLEDTNDTAV